MKKEVKQSSGAVRFNNSISNQHEMNFDMSAGNIAQASLPIPEEDAEDDPMNTSVADQDGFVKLDDDSDDDLPPAPLQR